MTKINEIPQEPRERLRAEILHTVGERRDQSEASLRQLTTYLGILYTGATGATLGLLASSTPASKSTMTLWALSFFGISVISFAILLHWHYRLMTERDNAFSHLATAFFHRDAELEDILEIQGHYTSVWLFRLLFWLPFSSFIIGVATIATAVIAPEYGLANLTEWLCRL